MLEGLVTVILLIAIDKVGPQNSRAESLHTGLQSLGRVNPDPQLTAGSCVEGTAFQQRREQSSGDLAKARMTSETGSGGSQCP